MIQQLLVESALLGLAGGAVGLLAAVGTVRAIVGLFGTALPRASQVGIDGPVLAFTTVSRSRRAHGGRRRPRGG